MTMSPSSAAERIRQWCEGVVSGHFDRDYWITSGIQIPDRDAAARAHQDGILLLSDITSLLDEHQRALDELAGVSARAVAYRHQVEELQMLARDMRSALEEIEQLPDRHRPASDAANTAMELARKTLAKGAAAQS